MRADYYMIDGVNDVFESLRDAKYHIYFAYTPNERIRYFGDDCSYICGVNAKSEEIVTTTLIKVDHKGREAFGRTTKY